MPGFACDKSTRRCVHGVAGVLSRDKDECSFGHLCYQELPVPVSRGERHGVCKPGLENTFACRRDMHCARPLRCFSKPVTLLFDVTNVHRCGKLANFASTPLPNGFRNCATNFDCNPFSGLNCVADRCQPHALG